MDASISGTYVVDRKRSSVEIHGTSSVHPIEMRSHEPEGALTIDSSNGTTTARGSLVIAVKTLRTGQPLQDLELRRRIQARRYPTIEATLRHVRSADGDRFEVSGDVTFVGVTNAVDGTLTITRVDNGIAISGESIFDVTEFGFQPPNILGIRVAPQVTVRIDLLAVPET